MTRADVLTKEGIDAEFMHWLWYADRRAYTLIILGHTELITDKLVQEFCNEHISGKEQ